jgi:hypothetical protein
MGADVLQAFLAAVRRWRKLPKSWRWTGIHCKPIRVLYRELWIYVEHNYDAHKADKAMWACINCLNYYRYDEGFAADTDSPFWLKEFRSTRLPGIDTVHGDKAWGLECWDVPGMKGSGYSAAYYYLPSECERRGSTLDDYIPPDERAQIDEFLELQKAEGKGPLCAGLLCIYP